MVGTRTNTLNPGTSCCTLTWHGRDRPGSRSQAVGGTVPSSTETGQFACAEWHAERMTDRHAERMTDNTCTADSIAALGMSIVVSATCLAFPCNALLCFLKSLKICHLVLEHASGGWIMDKHFLLHAKNFGMVDVTCYRHTQTSSGPGSPSCLCT